MYAAQCIALAWHLQTACVTEDKRLLKTFPALKAYANMTFATLHARICEALRGDRPRVVATCHDPGGRVRILFEDGTAKEVGT